MKSSNQRALIMRVDPMNGDDAVRDVIRQAVMGRNSARDVKRTATARNACLTSPNKQRWQGMTRVTSSNKQ